MPVAVDRLGRNPFTPDFDVPPPVLAGREKELKILSQMATDLDTGSNVRSIVLYGPRGNGKTALLNSSDRYKPRRTRIRIVQTLAQALRSPQDLADVLLEKTGPSKAGLSKVGGSLKVLGVGVSAERQNTDSHDAVGTDAVVQSLTKRRKFSSPTILMLDEAHDLDREVGRMALAIASRMKAEKTPFGLVLSGTPGIRRRLAEFDNWFIESAQLVRVSRLDNEATRKALFEPFGNAGCTIELTKDEMDRVLEWTQNYPYFIQELGSMLFSAAKAKGENRITGDLLPIAKREFDLATEQMYGQRIDEIVRRGLIKPALAVAKASLDGAGSVSRKDLYNSVGKCSDSRSPQDILDEFIDLGFISMSAKSSQRYDAGIPSLMNNIVSKEGDLPT